MITIVPYDPSWPRRFAQEAQRLRRRFGDRALRIDHVGSTAVPRLAAKPVIDIQVSLASLTPADSLAGDMAELGYTHVALGDFDLVYPFFHRPSDWPATHHVHLCVAGQEQERRHLSFRDYLRRHPSVATAYLHLKYELAALHDGATAESREAYSLAKGEFVEAAIVKAFQERLPVLGRSEG